MATKMIIKDYIVFKDGEARLADKEHLKAELVARMYVNGHRDIDYIMEHYGLSRSEVHATLAYYYDNQEALDEAYERDWRESKAIKSADLEAKIKARMRNEE